MDIFKKIMDTANDAVESATDKLGDLKDAALEKAAEIRDRIMKMREMEIRWSLMPTPSSKTG